MPFAFCRKIRSRRSGSAELEQSASSLKELGRDEEVRQRVYRKSVAAFVISFALFIAFESAYAGIAFGFGFSVLILVHEFGHFVDVKRRGLKADLPVFLPGIGAFVRLKTTAITKEVRAGVSLAGPFAGFLSAVACAAIWYATGNKYWAALAQSAAWLNVVNMTPVWVLDGGQAASALGRVHRFAILVLAVAAWRFTGESVFFVVAAGALYRAFSKDVPEEPSQSAAAYFIALMALLAAVMYYVPGTGFGT